MSLALSSRGSYPTFEKNQEAAVNFKSFPSPVPHLEQEQEDGTWKCFINLNLSSQMSSTGISFSPLGEQQSQSLSWCSVTWCLGNRKQVVWKWNFNWKTFSLQTYVDQTSFLSCMFRNIAWCLELTWRSCSFHEAVSAFESVPLLHFQREIQAGNCVATMVPFCTFHSTRHCSA